MSINPAARARADTGGTGAEVRDARLVRTGDVEAERVGTLVLDGFDVPDGVDGLGDAVAVGAVGGLGALIVAPIIDGVDEVASSARPLVHPAVAATRITASTRRPVTTMRSALFCTARSARDILEPVALRVGAQVRLRI
jgi:hypothetical protein